MNIKTLTGSLLIATFVAFGQGTQPLSLDSCYALALRNYPLLKQTALIERTAEFSIQNAEKAYLPQINFAGQATYQSEVTKIPISLPGISIKQLSKDQYKIYGEINQSLTDAFIVKQQKQLIGTNLESEKEKLSVELYKLKERINQLFFGILVLDEQMLQSELVTKDLDNSLKKLNAGIKNGINLQSQADQLMAEKLKIEQRMIEQQHARKGFGDMLAVFINRPFNEEEKLQTPNILNLNQSINRPELKLFDIQRKGFDIQNQLLDARYAPKLSLFFQGGYGRPTLNALSNDFGTYYIGGARFSWNISNYYTLKKEKQIQGINQQVLDVQKDVFLFNTKMALKQQNSEVEKIAALIKSDEAMIALREKIKNTANVQLENGTITMNDYLVTLNAEDQAKQNLVLHKIQFILAQYTFQNTSGN